MRARLHRRERPRLTGLGYLVTAVTIVAGCWSAGCGGDAGTTAPKPADHTGPAHSSGGISQADQRAAQRRLSRELGVSASRVKRLKSGRGLPARTVRPGEIVPAGPGPFFSSDVIWPIRNGWQASDRRSYTAVEAGVNPADRSVGELGIFRQKFIRATQSQHVIDVPGAGALKITAAPLGRSVATWSQRRGSLRFVGKRGVRGTLHLRNDKVLIHQRGAAQPN